MANPEATNRWVFGNGCLPSPAFRERAAHAVHQAVLDVTGSDGDGYCAAYAVAGSVVLNVLQREHAYMPQAGTATVQCSRDGTRFAFDAEAGGVTAYEYHSWIARLHAPPGEAEVEEPEAYPHIEVVDFAYRFFHQQAIRFGARWDMPHPPDFVWGWSDEMPPGTTFRAVEGVTEHVAHMVEAQGFGRQQAAGRFLRPACPEGALRGESMTATATETEITTEWTEADVETLKTAVKMCAEAGLEWCHELKRVDLAAVWAKVEQDRAEEHAHHLRYCAERVAERTAEDPTWAVKNAKHHLVIGLHSTPEPLPPMPVMPEAMWPFLVQALENLASLPEEVVEAARDRAEERYGDNFEEWFNEEGAEFIARQALSVYGSRYGSECDPVESVLNWDENSFIKERADYLRREKEKAIKAAENSVKAATRVLTLLKGQ